MSSQYLISDENVFHATTSSPIWLDTSTFRAVGEKGPVAVDKDFAFWGTGRFEADPGTLTCVLPGLLYKDGKAVYAYGAKLGRTDSESFRLLSHPHPCLALAADRHQRFIFESLTGGFMSQPDPLGANAAKLKKVLAITRAPLEQEEAHWIEQVSRTYVPAGPPPDGEETAMVLTSEGACLETRQRVPCDPASFEAITATTGRDKDHFFCTTTIIPEVDKDTVESISDTFFKDKKHVFCLWGPYTPIPKADPGSFRLIEPYFYPVRYAADDKAGYCLMYGSQRLKVKRFTLPDPKALRTIQPEYGSERAEFGLATDGMTVFKDGVAIKTVPQP